MGRPLKSGHKVTWSANLTSGKCSACGATFRAAKKGPQQGASYVITKGVKKEIVPKLSAAKKCTGRAAKKKAA